MDDELNGVVVGGCGGGGSGSGSGSGGGVCVDVVFNVHMCSCSMLLQ